MSVGSDLYAEARALQVGLEGAGLPGWSSEIDDAVVAGATGSEVLMGLRWVLDRLTSETGLPAELRSQARELLDMVQAALR